MTLIVEMPDGAATGTAFLGIKEGVAITAWHVVRKAKRVVAKFSSGEIFESSGLIDKDEVRDIALIRIKIAGRPLIPFTAGDPAVGARAFTIGAPKGLEFSLSDGLVSQIQTLDGIKQYQFSCPISPGNSGGPLLDSHGKVLGVVDWQLVEGQNLNFAVPITYVRGLDATLPTTPWSRVVVELPDEEKEAEPEAAGPTDPPSNDPKPGKSDDTLPSTRAEVDAAMIDCLWAYCEASTATRYALMKSFEKNSPSSPVVPPEIPRALVGLDGAEKALKKLHLSDAQGQSFRTELLQGIADFREAIKYVTDAIAAKRKKGEVDEGIQNSMKRCIEMLYEGDNITIKGPFSDELWTGSLRKKIPPDLFRVIGQDVDDLGYLTGMWTWPRKQNVIAVAWQNGFGYELGFRHDDQVLSIAGQTVDNLDTLKSLIRTNLGKEVRWEVVRDGQYKRLTMRLPASIPSKYIVNK